MNALDVYTKRNIQDYLARPEAKFDKEYSKERQEIRQYIRKDDLAAKKGHPKGGLFSYYLQIILEEELTSFALKR